MEYKKWELDEAAASLEEVFDSALKDGPQIITQDSKEIAVMISLKEWQRLKRQSRKNA